jgi:hypothetical protein
MTINNPLVIGPRPPGMGYFSDEVPVCLA